MIDLNLALLGLILSIVYSSSEIALLSANPLQVDVWEKQEKRLSRWTSAILDKKSEYLAVILIGTNLSNILTTSFATVYLLRLDIIPTGLIVIPIAAIILLLGEILPKTVIRDYSNTGLMVLSPFLKFSYFLFSPLVIPLRHTGWMNISENIRSSSKHMEEKRDDIQHAYEQVEDPKAIEKEQKEMISNVFECRESTVYEAMTPRTDISAVSNADSLEKVLHTFIDSGHSKLPVYESNLDNIIGVIYLYDLFHAPENINDVIKPVLYVPYTKSIMDLMLEFKSAHHALAIVLDEHGGSAGIITAEDLFEKLFGEFEDEFDEDLEKYSQLSDGSIVVNARMDWEGFNQKFGALIPDGEYETIGGYIISELGRIPNKGEHLFMTIGQVIIINASSRQIHQVQIFPQIERSK